MNPPSKPSLPRLPRGEAFALLAITLVGIVLRIWGNDHGLPWITEPDDENVRIGLGLARGITPLGALLESSRYPHLMLYLMWFCDRLWIDPSLPIAEAYSAAIQIGRTLSGILAGLAIVPTFLIARHVAGSRAGFAAAMLLCFDVMSVQNGHLAKPHAPLLAFSTGALWYAVRHQQTGARRDLVVAALLGGLAGAMIHSGFAVFAGIAVAALLAPSGGSHFRRLLTLGSICAVAISFAAIVGYPNALATLLRIVQGHAEAGELMGPHTTSGLQSLGLAGFALPAWVLTTYFPLLGPFGLTALVVLSALPGRRRPTTLALLATTVLFFAVFGHRAVFASRFMLPVVPCFLIAASAALDALSRLLPIRVQSPAFYLAAILLGAWPGATSVRLAFLYSRPDTRELAGTWIEQNVPVEQALAATPYLDLPLALDADSLARHQQLVQATTSWTRIQLEQLREGHDPLATQRRSVWFPFRIGWTASVEERSAWLAAQRIRYAISLFDNPERRVDPTYNVFPPHGELVFETSPGPPGFTGAELYSIPFPLHWIWIMERGGPAIEIVKVR